jgi:hypothetical protein
MVLIDDFETDLSDWSVDGATISTDHAYTGSSSVKLTNKADYISQGTPAVGFSRENRAKFYVWPWFSTSTLSFIYGRYDSGSYYEFSFDPETKMLLSRYDNSNSTTIGSNYNSGAAPEYGVWSEIEIDWSASDTFTVYINGIEKLSATDSTYSGNGSFEFTEGYYVWIDDFYINSTATASPPAAPTGLTLTQL